MCVCAHTRERERGDVFLMDQAFLCITVTSCFNASTAPVQKSASAFFTFVTWSVGGSQRSLCVCVTASDVFSSLLLFL